MVVIPQELSNPCQKSSSACFASDVPRSLFPSSIERLSRTISSLTFGVGRFGDGVSDKLVGSRSKMKFHRRSAMSGFTRDSKR